MTVAPIEPSVILQANATVIAGLFIFLTIQGYTAHKNVYGRDDIEVKKEFINTSIIIIIFAASSCVTLIPILYPISITLTIAGFVYIIIELLYYFKHQDRIHY
jgi:hypothetical protein